MFGSESEALESESALEEREERSASFASRLREELRRADLEIEGCFDVVDFLLKAP